MKILTTLTVSGGLNMASTAKDTFTIGTPLENNDGNVDNLYVHANAYLNNHVVLGSSSADTVTVSGNLVINPVATPPTSQEGQIYYDSNKHELVYNSEVSTVLNSLGRSLLVRAKNIDTVTLTKGMAVRVSTPQGANKTFVRALSVNIPLTGAAGNQIIGVINADIAVNNFGYATTFGEITGLNTNTFIEGDQVYVSSTTSGSLTGSRPTAPFEIIPVGICLSQHLTQGKIFVKTRDPTHFGDITGFNPDTTNLLNGQVIRYRSSDGTWGNSNSGVILTGSFSGSLIGTASHAATASNYYIAINQAGDNDGTTYPIAYGFSSNATGKSVNILSLKQGTNITLSQSVGNLTVDVDQTAWTAYTPTWTAGTTNPAIGNGTIQGYYKVIGKTCFVRGNIAMGSTTTFGSGEWYVSMPFTASNADAILMTVTLLDNGSAWYNATLNGARAGYNYKAAMQYQHISNGTAADVNATAPFTWANTDRFIWNGSYEIA